MWLISKILLLVLASLLLLALRSSAFVIPGGVTKKQPAPIIQRELSSSTKKQQVGQQQVRKVGSSTSSSSALAAAPPLVDDWTVLSNGAVTGTAKGHPTIPNGDIITTSAISLTDRSAGLKANMVVTTKSGSQYKLGRASMEQQQVELAAKAKQVAAAQRKAKKAAVTANKKPTSPPKAVVVKKAAVAAKPSSKPSPSASSASAKASQAQAEAGKFKSLLEKQRRAKAEYGLNGKTVGNGKYLLVGQQIRSSSRRSQIYYAYKSDGDGLPTGPRLTVKISDTYERLSRENNNYNQVTGGLFQGRFVKKIEFLEEANCSSGITRSREACALVLESGQRNLRDLCNARKNVGLSGTTLRQTIVAIAQCVQGVHSSGLVWTDLKAENFVTTTDSLGESDLQVKGIDLESTVKAGGPPIDYSPEACPPDFAIEEAAGRGTDFRVNYNYDSWSLGILLYELAVGRSIYGNRSDNEIARLLRQGSFEPDVNAVEDDRLRDLIEQCLQLDPKKRPEITQILLHPYFLTTGIGPFSF